ncbi:MAG: VWA domain-containing protein, partial [Pirellulaceae bacterium]
AEPRDIRLTPEQQKMLAAESAAIEARRPRGPPTSLSVFGSGQMTGRKFVFVMDRSKSMGAQGLNVINAAASELGAAISSLEDHHQFQIVAYHHMPLTIGPRELLNATEDHKGEVAEFITNLAAFGGTEHEGALFMALSMNPDVVVLLTDGGLPSLNESQLTRIRRAADGAQIHCIQFGSGPSQNSNTFMQKLAVQNVGSYRYIDVSTWSE